MSCAELRDVPPGLDVFVDFISDDPRPTFIVEHSSATPKVLFRNVALDAILSDTSRGDQFTSWLNTIHETIRHQAGQHARRVAKLGTFALRHWSSKTLKGPWTAVFCRSNNQFDNQGPYKSLRPRNNKGRPALNREYSSRGSQQEQSGNTHEDSDRDSMRDSDSIMTTDSRATSVLQEAHGTTGLLEDWIVDWLNHPHLTRDPWIQFLVQHDWSKTAAGPMHGWDPALKQLYSTILTSEVPRIIYWGNDLCMFYNEAARFVVGEMHPEPLGNPLAQVWGTPMWSRLTEMLVSGIKRGKPMHNKGTELIIFRNGFTESAFFDFVFLPIPSPDGRFIGVLNDFIETTTAVLQEDRQKVCKRLIEGVSGAKELRNVWDTLLNVLKTCKDVSFAIVYAHDSLSASGSDTSSMRAQSSFGIDTHDNVLSSTINNAVEESVNKVLVLDRPTKTLPRELEVTIPDLGVVHTSYVLPIDGLYGQRVSAVVVIGSNPRRAVDAGSIQFFESLRDLLFKSIALLSLPAEQRRANELTTSLSYQLAVATSKAEKSERNFTEMVHHAPIGMCLDRGDGYPVYVNDAYLDLLDTDRTSFDDAAKAGFAWRSADFQRNADAIEESWWTAVKSGQTSSFEICVECGSRLRWFEIFVQQRYDDNGALVYIFSWITDISARKLVESVVEERLAEAIENRRASENFIDMISHEMRNPLSSILQLADSISTTLPPVATDDKHTSMTNGHGSTLTQDVRDVLLDTAQTITLCAKHQKNIIDEVLTFSKLDSKLLVLAPEAVQPLKIISDVLRMNKPELAQADIQGSLDIESSFKDLNIDYVTLDPGRVSQVIINFINNAIKFTRTCNVRKIKLSLSASQTRPTAKSCNVTLIEPRDKSRYLPTAEANTEAEVFLTFSVQDTGCGLTPAEIKNLFQRFSQASPKTYKRYGGSGLGLFISRELVELQGGQVGVHSEAGKGSTFGFYIKAIRVQRPLALRSKSSEISRLQPPIKSSLTAAIPVDNSPTSKTKVQDLHVLVVEDNVINQRVMSQQLTRLGCAKVYTANHGLEALDFLATTTFCNGNVPLSIVLLDVEMPIMDGLTCARKVRELEKLREIVKHVPICGITANARVSQIDSCIEAGMDEVVTKPFRMPELLPRMLALVDKHTAP
ncbi:hypothetical protein E4T52_03328 [Aureobasidium sp. EXF-3400]|nr:hypothetical protein E4T51_02587 [Aureobasidium sp. EXF-12344]KAI4781774.1 hypothetical protein E4T52_03328 [Aureobasidium sp. EXF-3400]